MRSRACQNSFRLRARTRGFTLVEILTVVVILGIAAAVVIPHISDRSDLRAAAGARVVMADLLWAQNRAIATQKTHYVHFDTVAQRYSLYDDLAMTTALVHPVHNEPFVQKFNYNGWMGIPDVSLYAVDFSGQQIIAFDALGQPLAVSSDGAVTELDADGKIVLSSGTYQIQLTVKPFTGAISTAAIP